MKKHLFLNLFFGFFFFQITVGAFAADLCENLSENACGQLFRGVQEWNERHGDSVKAIDWKYAGQVNDTKALANKLMDPKTTWVPHQVEENHIRAVQLSTIEKLPRFPFEQWKKDWRQELEWMLRRAKHVVNPGNLQIGSFKQLLCLVMME